MLEGRRRRKPQSLLQLFHECVRIQRVEEVDVPRSAEQNWSLIPCQGKVVGRGQSSLPLNGNSPSVTKAWEGFW